MEAQRAVVCIELGMTKSTKLAEVDGAVMKRVNMHEAKTHLSRLVDEAVAGQAFVICKAGKPMVRVTPLNQPDAASPVRSRLGMLRRQLSVPDDFDRMGQEEIADLFEGIGER